MLFVWEAGASKATPHPLFKPASHGMLSCAKCVDSCCVPFCLEETRWAMAGTTTSNLPQHAHR